MEAKITIATNSEIITTQYPVEQKNGSKDFSTKRNNID